VTSSHASGCFSNDMRPPSTADCDSAGPPWRSFSRYIWPGNVRELQNIIERIVAVCKEKVVREEMVLQMMQEDEPSEPLTVSHRATPEDRIRTALLDARGRQGEAAKLLGISRSTLWRRMKKLGVLPPGSKPVSLKRSALPTVPNKLDSCIPQKRGSDSRLNSVFSCF